MGTALRARIAEVLTPAPQADGSGANFKKGRRADPGALGERESLACQIGPKFKICTRSVSITWGALWSTRRPMRYPWRESYLIAWTSKAGWSRWTPYTPRTKPHVRWSWNTGPIIC